MKTPSAHTDRLRAVFRKYRHNPEFLMMSDDELRSVDEPGLLTGDTMLHIAARSHPVEDVSELLRLGADVNAKGDSAYTALHYATSSGRPDVVRLLLNSGANTSARNEWGDTAEDVLNLCGDRLTAKVRKTIAATLRRRL